MSFLRSALQLVSVLLVLLPLPLRAEVPHYVALHEVVSLPYRDRVPGTLPSIFRAELPLQASSPEKRKEIEIYVAEWCPHCRRLESYLRSKNIRFTRYDIESDPASASRYRALGGGGIPLVKINGQVIRGFNQPAIESALEE